MHMCTCDKLQIVHIIHIIHPFIESELRSKIHVVRCKYTRHDVHEHVHTYVHVAFDANPDPEIMTTMTSVCELNIKNI